MDLQIHEHVLFIYPNGRGDLRYGKRYPALWDALTYAMGSVILRYGMRLPQLFGTDSQCLKYAES